MFQAAFGNTTVTIAKINKALAQFMRSMNTFGSRYRYGVDHTNGNPETTPFANFTAQENLGKSLFMDITRGNCQACHTRNMFVQQGAQNIGLDLVYTDNGVGAISGGSRQNGKFSVPSLINIELTAPYMHDGRFKTLSEVINHYGFGVQNNDHLSDELKNRPPAHNFDSYSGGKKADILAFLRTLDDQSSLHDPKFSSPFEK